MQLNSQRWLALAGAMVALSASLSGADQMQPEASNYTYRIGPGDVLQVDIWKEPEASTTAAPVRPDGTITLPIIGEIKAAGLMIAEFQNDLHDRYATVIRDARVSVVVREVNSQRIYLIGEVRREGPIRMVAPLTVLQALAEGGGLTDYAKRKKIYILRANSTGRKILPFDYEAVVRGSKVQQNIVLLPGDTVVVPR